MRSGIVTVLAGLACAFGSAAPAGVVESRPGYNAWPMLAATSNRLVCVYSRGKDHSYIHGERDAWARRSTDGGRTWSDPVAVAASPDAAEVPTGKGLDGSGAMLFWIRAWGPAGCRHDLWRTDDSLSFERIARPALDPVPMQITDIVRLGDRLFCLWFACDYGHGGRGSWGTLVSADDGRTWRQTTVEADLPNGETPTEPSVVVLPGNRLLAVARCEDTDSPDARQFQLTSADGGLTWERRRTNIGDIFKSTPSLVYDPSADLVCNYYYERGKRRAKRRVALGSRVFDNPEGWPDPEVVARGSEKRPWDAGNVNAAVCGTTHYLAFYSGNERDTSVTVQSVPPAASLAADAPKDKLAESFRITPSDIPNRGLTFVDYRPTRRSGHMGHALAEYARDSLLAFYPNTSGSLNYGHTGYGWMEYRRSTDGGRTWGDPKVLDYSYLSFIDGQFTISSEKAVVTDKGTVVLFCCRNSTLRGWEPYLEPTALRSTDAGETWSEPIPVSREKGRIYDARFRDGVIYVLEFCNGTARWCGNRPEHLYRLYVSVDDGATFRERGVVPFETTRDRAYGFLTWLPDGRLMAACYNVTDEYNLDCIVSDDGGVTWGKPFKSFCAKRIRNPQVFRLGGTYFLHGRSGNETRELPFNFVLYSSPDGIHWDEGRYLSVPDDGEWGNYSYYSNNCVLGRFGGKPRALIQASVPYDEARENVAHWWIDPLPENK